VAKFKDLTGLTFGRLTVESLCRKSYRSSTGDRFNTLWTCVCSCGKTSIVSTGALTGGKQVSCGCNKREQATRHGLHAHPLYSVWHRCYDTKQSHYNRYGGRGIAMVESWVHDVSVFVNDVISEIGERPSGKHTLDRIDNDAGYGPGNIRWATMIEQANNRSSTVFIKYNGEIRSLMGWCETFNLYPSTVAQRLNKGWSVDRAFNTPTRFGFRRRGESHEVQLI
jgi:hypothetical protein